MANEKAENMKTTGPGYAVTESMHEEPTTSRNPEINSPSTDPPDGGYGWVCVACCFTINCFTWGVVAVSLAPAHTILTFPFICVYLAYYLSSARFPESKPLDYAFIGGLNFAMAMLAGPLITALCREIGIKPPMLAGVAMFAGAFIAASFATQIWHLYLSQGALAGLGVGFINVPSISILSQWFSKRRSLANGISAAGSGIGGLIFSLATGTMIERLSLAWSLRVIGIITFATNLLATVFIRDRNAIIQPKQRPFDLDLFRRVEVLLLLSWAFISMLGYITLLYSLSDFAFSIWPSSEQATQVTAFLNLGTALGRPFIGVASDRFGRFEVTTALTLLCGLSCFAIWIPASSFGVTVFFGIVSGAILGVFWVTIGPLSVEVAGLKQLPSLLSLSWLAVVIPTAFSEVIALYLRRPGHKHAYLYPQLFCGLCYVCASLCLWGVRVICSRRHRESR